MSGKRYLGTFFRGWRLYVPVLLLLLVATGVGTYYLARTQYEATARLWVEKPALDNVLDPNGTSSFSGTPAQQLADRLSQLVQTDSFIAAVISGTKESGRLATRPEKERAISDVRGKLDVTPLGSNTVRVTFAGGDPVLCQQVVQSTLDQFRNRALTARVEQSAVEHQFYEKQLQIYQGQVNAAAKRLADFQNQHPFPDPSSPQYLEMQGLQRDVESARALLNATSAKIEQADAANSLSDTSGQAQFQVLDAPVVPDRPAATLGRLLQYIGLGLLVSFGLIFIAVAFATWQDTTIRNADDLQRVTDAPFLDAIPHLGSSTVGGGQRQQRVRARRAPRVAAGQLEEPGAVYSHRVVE